MLEIMRDVAKGERYFSDIPGYALYRFGQTWKFWLAFLVVVLVVFGVSALAK